MTRDRGLDEGLTARAGRSGSASGGPSGGSGATLRRPERRGAAEGVVCLQHDEPTRFDADRLEALCLALGDAEAEAAVADALARIATLIGDLDWLIAATHPSLLRLCLESLARDADMIGMTTLAHVAEAAADCLDRDDAARSAALARLRRIGERSILAVWDLDDMS
jgi:hypothetical protein